MDKMMMTSAIRAPPICSDKFCLCHYGIYSKITTIPFFGLLILLLVQKHCSISITCRLWATLISLCAIKCITIQNAKKLPHTFGQISVVLIPDPQVLPPRIHTGMILHVWDHHKCISAESCPRHPAILSYIQAYVIMIDVPPNIYQIYNDQRISMSWRFPDKDI
jgi:hypothetical protein